MTYDICTSRAFIRTYIHVSSILHSKFLALTSSNCEKAPIFDNFGRIRHRNSTESGRNYQKAQRTQRPSISAYNHAFPTLHSNVLTRISSSSEKGQFLAISAWFAGRSWPNSADRMIRHIHEPIWAHYRRSIFSTFQSNVESRSSSCLWKSLFLAIFTVFARGSWPNWVVTVITDKRIRRKEIKCPNVGLFCPRRVETPRINYPRQTTSED